METTNLLLLIVATALLLGGTALAILSRHWVSLVAYGLLGVLALGGTLAHLTDSSPIPGGSWVAENAWLIAILVVVFPGALAIRAYGESEELGSTDNRYAWLRRLAGAGFGLAVAGVVHLLAIGSIWLFSYV